MSDKDQEAPQPDEAAEAGEAIPGENASDAPVSESEQLAALQAEITDYRDRLLRSMAEMDNLRKRTQREKDDATRFAISRFARDIIGISDDLSRAIEAVPPEARSGDDATVTGLLAGIELTERQLQQVFERHGVKRFDPAGEKFDPMVHEAMYEVPDPSQPAGTVAQVVEPGYMIADRVLRPARVGVSAGGPKSAPKPKPETESPAAAKQAEIGDPALEGQMSETDTGAADQSADGGETTPESGTPTGAQEPAQPEQIGIKIDRSA
ncbi:MAG: nucleotide exchange factor GrpE [Rhizobiales bacterium]|nr:nucleotide exchange factor GrpE [Hyphomicrobiales bacterium]